MSVSSNNSYIDNLITEPCEAGELIESINSEIKLQAPTNDSGSTGKNDWNSEARDFKEYQGFINNDKIDIEELNSIFINNHISNTNRLDFKNYFSKTQKWIGHVIEINRNGFTGKLFDLNKPGTHEIGEFEFDEITQDDKELLEVGSAFYWSIGYEMKNGTVKKISLLRFQRILNWTSQEYDDSVDRASILFSKLKWD